MLWFLPGEVRTARRRVSGGAGAASLPLTDLCVFALHARLPAISVLPRVAAGVVTLAENHLPMCPLSAQVALRLICNFSSQMAQVRGGSLRREVQELTAVFPILTRALTLINEKLHFYVRLSRGASD